MKDNPLLKNSERLAVDIEALCKTLERKDNSNAIFQIRKSSSSVFANINEAIYGNSKADFISKLHISLKETGESIYWLTLLKRTNLIEYNFDELLSLAEEIKRMLIASLNTAKENK